VKFEEDCRKLAKLVNIPGFIESDPKQDVKQVVKGWLESDTSGDWILVLDNADNKLDFFPNPEQDAGVGLVNYIPRTTKGTIVIATRDYEVAHNLVGRKSTLTKKSMEPVDAAALFMQHYPSGDLITIPTVQSYYTNCNSYL
jgi:hypothetical protein